MESIRNALGPFRPPQTAYVRQKLHVAAIEDLPRHLKEILAPIRPSGVRPGQSVAVAVGSRGIRQLDCIVLHCIHHLKSLGLRPFIVPAMGSHGGASAQGQLAVLKRLGITETAMQAPIASDMTVRCIGELDQMEICLDQAALDADHIVIVNRIKPHTKFNADIESGLCKMLTIGLGKDRGARAFHRCAVRHGFGILEKAAAWILRHQSILFGLAVVEDGFGQPAHVEVVLPGRMIEREKALLKDAYRLMPGIPLNGIDLLIVDFIGKDISGIGMDSNVTGRHRDIVGDFFTHPHVRRIFVRDLSPGSDGNASGIGLADITTRRLVERMDRKKTYVNALTAISLEKAAIPMYFDTDRECLQAAAAGLGLDNLNAARMVRIQDTSKLEIFQVSKAFESEINADPELTRITEWAPMTLDSQGNLPAFESPLP